MRRSVSPACYIHHIATALPQRWIDQSAGPGLLKQGAPNPRTARLMERITRLTGIERRYLAALDYQLPGREDEWLYRPPQFQPGGPGMTARSEAFRTSADPLVREALAQLPAGTLEAIKTLVTVTCTHAGSPGLEAPILAHAPVPPTVSRWNLGFMGCSAGLAGIRLVHQLPAAHRRALVVACELSSLHFQYTEQIDQMTANMLFADGLAAVALSPEPSPPASVAVIGCRCVSLPQFAGQMVWFAGDHGLQLSLAQELPETLAAHLPAAVDAFLAEFETSRARIDHWLVHPGGPQILDAVAESIGLTTDALDGSRSVLRRYGNMSSPTILFILRDLLEVNPRGRGLAMAFGPGLTIELVLLEFGPA